ncbi:hypothetical protein [Chlamydiifrater volucris]|uniref:hypothetical protein n=1 Tax=Chlamydiifrater volucris TaxID=2681470 RepID=UPI001BD1692B|nr:hypothetical protein [Chlamydiifrater volucris]
MKLLFFKRAEEEFITYHYITSMHGKSFLLIPKYKEKPEERKELKRTLPHAKKIG